MDADIENFRELCLMCASPPNANEPHTDIFSNSGRIQKLLDKIHTHLTIQVSENDGMPHGLCPDCISKLNMCHDIVLCSEKAHAKLLSLRAQWVVKNEPNCMDADDISIDNSSAADFVPSPSSNHTTTINRNDCAGQSSANVAWDPLGHQNEATELQLDPNIKPSSQVIIGSQIAFFYADKEEVDLKPKVNLVVINMSEEVANNRYLQVEKLSRVVKDVKNRSKLMTVHYKSTGNLDLKPSFSCSTCRYSFFLKEEMVCHFESLHPCEVIQCPQCSEIVCGPKPVLNKHMELHKPSVEDESYILLNMCSSLLDPSLECIEPEFVVVPLGDFNWKLQNRASNIISSLGQNVIKSDMESKILNSLTTFITQVNMPSDWLKGQCTVCGKSMSHARLQKHMEIMHNSNKLQCCHCQIDLQKETIETHIEKYHSGGKYLICQICDEVFKNTSREQPHMMKEPNNPFKCPVNNCKLTFAQESALQTHTSTFVHISKKKSSKVKKRRKKNKDKPLIPARNSYDMEKYHIPGLDLSQKTGPQNFPKYKCPYSPCNNVYKLFHKLKAHIQGVHVGPVYCDICGKAYKNKLNVKDHMKFVHFPTRGAIICHVCGKPYANRRSLKLHVRNVHDTKFPCELCGKEYSQKQMKEHKRIQHDGIKFQCKYCGKFLNGKTSLKRHEAIHEGVKFSCDICKPKLHFTTESIMKKHMLKHKNGEEITIPERLQPVKCPICYKEMASRSLKDHMKLKHSNARTLASLL